MSINASERIGIIGLGLLGRGIAACFLSRGFSVIGHTPTPAEHEEAFHEIESMVDERIGLGLVDSDTQKQWKNRFHQVTELTSFSECRFVIESVPEDLAIKIAVLDGVEALVATSTVIASNTSAIPISLLQQSRKHPARMVGMHWAEPAHTTRFLELIRGEQTSAETFEAALQMGRRLGKEPIACQKDVPGFIVNRIAYAMYREACYLIEMGIADAEAIDVCMRNTLGLWASICGPLRWIDISGGPTLYAKAMARVLPTLSNSTTIPSLMQGLVDQHAHGTINGRGFHEYTPDEAALWKERYRRQVIDVMKMHDREFPLA